MSAQSISNCSRQEMYVLTQICCGHYPLSIQPRRAMWVDRTIFAWVRKPHQYNRYACLLIIEVIEMWIPQMVGRTSFPTCFAPSKVAKPGSPCSKLTLMSWESLFITIVRPDGRSETAQLGLEIHTSEAIGLVLGPP